MNKELTPLEALEKIKEHLTRYDDLDEIRGIDYESEINLIENALKELKALEIIKKSIIATPNIPRVKTPIGDFVEITLAVTNEEYDLLKEVLL